MHSTFINHRNRLAAAIARDFLTERKQQQQPTPTCFACGRPYHRGDGRFCSQRCRSAFDAGAPAYESRPAARLYSFPVGRNGFLIPCAGCGRQFDSTGLQYCSPECGRRDRERRENAELMAAVGMERPAKRKCANCGGNIPSWRPNGQRVSKATRFCSRKCRDRNGANAGMALGSPEAGFRRETAKMCPEIGARKARAK
jgi:hypothetical protein